ncbi:glycerol-3-phosphate o-acyltransferase [Chloropicon primus]|uniref:Glycerol-3-phosphate o-acyltransferase n=2 Tax=Chloropicon primus TaxID=1764295 RepID=A0A5B8MC07_9CHLO|nr:glycerol-3-phosphate o-acyltransferase [Chloropicon primus]UPQ96830.1 glycerol-3-phosphate o-acyltransferase [Chloropicon primus]|mmetsp:Transcript_21560/g.45334  ORF Transcript_21560/g.45334 Transcript_21560/m.45334 type:complete len:683 (-) Transcript_21560:914-2962(-)|eukprot:QDZ17614.1 glycerol-3-phosphate o-acyltransferase [Chloropicon primus]
MREASKSGSEMSESSMDVPETSTADLPKGKLTFSPAWFLWLGLGASATANSAGLPQEFSLALGAAFLTAFLLFGLTAKQILQFGVDALIELYFREYITMGSEKVPERGPVIFVCGPHSNQFLDPVVVSKGTKRDIRYITAAKSLRRKDVGWLFKYAEPVPVERQQDLKKKGTGRIRITDTGRVLGTETRFREEFGSEGKGKYQIQIKRTTGGQGKQSTVTMKVETVVSDAEIQLDQPPPATSSDLLQYYILPPVDHDVMFNKVYDHLGGGGALGIFPEGGSHDRTELLPLKVGVCLMALGAMAKHPQSRVNLVPVGLNYFSQDKFNSRVLVKYGDVLHIDIASPIMTMFKAGGELKKRAVRELLGRIEGALREVTVAAPDFSVLKSFWVLRDLYCPTKKLLEMSSAEQVMLAQAFAADYERVKGDPEVDPLLNRIKKYSRKLSGLGLKDKGNIKTALLVQESHFSKLRLLGRLVARVLYLAGMYVMFFPVHMYLFPVYVIAKIYSLRKSREAVAASTVKIKGKDVIGTYKLIIALPMLVVGHFGCSFLMRLKLGEAPAVAYFFFAPFLQFMVYKGIPNMLEYIGITRTLMLALFTTERAFSLIRERKDLKDDVRSLVDRLEWGFQYQSVKDLQLRRKESWALDSFRLEDMPRAFSNSMALLHDSCFDDVDLDQDLLFRGKMD